MTGMQMAMMAGGESAKVTLAASYSPTATTSTPTSASASFQLTNGKGVLSSGETPADWLNGVGNVVNYECRATQVSGSVISGTLASWLNLATSRVWGVFKSGGSAGVVVAQMTLEIRDASSLTVLATATVNFYAEVF